MSVFGVLQVWRRRAHNRVMTAAARIAGYCMVDCWQPSAASYGPGFAYWRCARLRRDCVSGWHRIGHYRWVAGQPPIYDVPPPGDEADLPRWLRGRFYEVMPAGRQRRWDRERRQMVRAAAKAAVERAQRRLAGMSDEDLMLHLRAARERFDNPVPGLRFPPVYGGPVHGLRSGSGADRHDWHVHGRRLCTCAVEHVDGPATGAAAAASVDCPVHGNNDEEEARS